LGLNDLYVCTQGFNLQSSHSPSHRRAQTEITEMDQDNLSQSKTDEEGSISGAEASTASSAPVLEAATDPTTSHAPAPPRPRRPQRTARIEGSVDISEPRVEPKTDPLINLSESTPDGTVVSHPKPSRPTGERTGPRIKAGPKGPGHYPVRAASVPQPPPSRPVPPHLTQHAERAMSVAGTADTQPQTLEDFRLVSLSLCLY
ncbi:hypothetical protein ILYODFUR_027678, partial [Ilyodon furcidens]